MMGMSLKDWELKNVLLKEILILLTLRFNLLYLQDYYDQLMVTDCNNNTIEKGESNDLIWAYSSHQG